MNTASMILTISVFLSAAWIIPVFSGGYANTVDRIGLFLHRHAGEVRKRQAERAKVLKRMWAEGRKRRRFEPVPIREERAV